MPQMMPMNWMILMIFFISMFYIYNTLIYFYPLYKTPHKNHKKLNYHQIWKW